VSDLVGRLRSAAGAHAVGCYECDWMGEAADEIERLRVELAGQYGHRRKQNDEIASLGEALNEAIRLLDGVDDDANNVRLEIARWQRRHHRWVDAEC
jgi:hypothetical protein